MIFQSVDLSGQFSPPQYGPDSPFYHKLCYRTDHIPDKSDACQYQKNGVNPSHLADFVYFAESDGGKGDDGHVEGVQKIPVLKNHVAEGTLFLDLSGWIC